MFTTLDCFCSDPELRDDDIDEVELLKRARIALSELDKL